jgi:hypothetical protein
MGVWGIEGCRYRSTIGIEVNYIITSKALVERKLVIMDNEYAIYIRGHCS